MAYRTTSLEIARTSISSAISGINQQLKQTMPAVEQDWSL